MYSTSKLYSFHLHVSYPIKLLPLQVNEVSTEIACSCFMLFVENEILISFLPPKKIIVVFVVELFFFLNTNIRYYLPFKPFPLVIINSKQIYSHYRILISTFNTKYFNNLSYRAQWRNMFFQSSPAFHSCLLPFSLPLSSDV